MDLTKRNFVGMIAITILESFPSLRKFSGAGSLLVLHSTKHFLTTKSAKVMKNLDI